MIEERKIAFDNISRTLAITRYDIEQHQLINDQSLNSILHYKSIDFNINLLTFT
jgi:hypothetical protein